MTSGVDAPGGADPDIDLTKVGLPPITLAEIETICQLQDDFYRNQYITYAYQQLSVRLAKLTGQNANWFTFARWSSFTVGENLRTDQPSAAFGELVSSHAVLRLLRGPIIRIQHDLRMLGDAAMPRTLAIGNHLVFHEIAYAVAAFLDWYEAAPTSDLAAWRTYRNAIVAADPTDLFQACDLAWLRDGIESYFLAIREPDPAAQSRLVLRGNVLLAVYEQWRLQPIVQIALDPVARHLVEFKGTNLHEDAAEPRAVLRHRGTRFALTHRSPVNQWLAHTYASLLTRYVMAWEGPIPGLKGALFLGRGIPELQGAPRFPPALADLNDRNLLVVSTFDHSGGTPAGRVAHNWARFNDRMNFIVNLFRAEQNEADLFAPISQRQTRVLDLDLSDGHLDGLREIGDEPLDSTLAAYVGPDTDPRAFVHQLIADDVPTDAVLHGHQALPDWVNRRQLEAGRKFLQEHGLEIGSALFFASLPMSYSAARGANVLTRTAELTTGHTTRRLAETGQMLLDLMLEDDGQAPLQPGTKGFEAAHGVRLFHAAVRHMVLTDTDVEWNRARLGMPINQEDLLGTLVVFTVVALDALEKLGVDFANDEARAARDAYVHYWLAVGNLLGIDYRRLRRGELGPNDAPLNLDELRLVQTAIFRRQAESSVGGQTLMASLLVSLERKLPWFMRGYPSAATRGLLGQEYSDVLGVPPAGPTRLLFDVVRVGTRVFSPRVPGQGLAALARFSSKRLYRSWIDNNDGYFPPWRLEAAKNWRLKREGHPERPSPTR
jgi:hypothetical protein